MGRPTGPVPGPMPAAYMEAVNDASTDDVLIYPIVDDKTELSAGDMVFVKASLVKYDGDNADYAVPGTILLDEGKITMTPLETSLWKKGFQQVATVDINDESTVWLFAKAEDDDDAETISECYDAPTEEVVTACTEKLTSANKVFSQWIAKHKEDRLAFLHTAVIKISKALTICQWKNDHRPEDPSGKISEDETAWFENEVITPTIHELTSAISDQEEKKQFKTKVSPKICTSIKYISLLMDIMCSDKGPAPPVPQAAGTQTEMARMSSQLELLQASFNALAAQLKVRDATTTEPQPGKMEAAASAAVIKIDGSAHECAYRVMSMAKAVNDGAQAIIDQPAIGEDDEAVDAVKEALLLKTREAYEKDPEGMKIQLDCDFGTYCSRVLEAEQDEDTWIGYSDFVRFSSEHPNVEIKIKHFSKMKLMTESTRGDEQPSAKKVMYAHWRLGHYDLLGIQEGERYKFAFEPAEVPAVETKIDSLLTSGQPAVSKMSTEEFRATIKAALSANRGKKAPTSCGKADNQRADAGKQAAVDLTVSKSTARTVTWSDQVLSKVPQRESLEMLARDETIRSLQSKLEAQSKQMHAQAQLALQARQQLKAMENKLTDKLVSKPSGEQSSTRASELQRESPIDMIINGATGNSPSTQPALVIWSDCGKKKMHSALQKIDGDIHKLVRKIERKDTGTKKARHIVYALPNDVLSVQRLATPLVATGARAEPYDPGAVTEPAWTLVTRKGKSKKANAAQEGLSAAIAKAGKSPSVRVRGQCDYYSASLACPNGEKCRFACWNGPSTR